VEYSRRTPWEKEVDLLQPILSSNCRNDEPVTSKSQLSAYLGFSASTMKDNMRYFGIYFNLIPGHKKSQQFCIILFSFPEIIRFTANY